VLGLNYPNPFNPITRLSYTVPSDARVSIKVFTMLGQEVSTLVEGVQSAGTHSVEWNGTNSAGNNLGSGVYYVRMTAGRINDVNNSVRSGYTGIRKIILMK
jgi:flagellar hook assembly protein FlgD